MTAPDLDQFGWIFGNNDASSTDCNDLTWGSENSKRSGQSKEETFMVRIRVVEGNANGTGNDYWQLFVNEADNAAGASQVLTNSSDIIITDGANLTHGEPTADLAALTDPTGTWQNGEYTESSDDSEKLDLDQAYYTDFQFAVQFTAGAKDGTTYYLFLRNSDAALTSHSAGGAQVETAAGSTMHICDCINPIFK